MKEESKLIVVLLIEGAIGIAINIAAFFGFARSNSYVTLYRETGEYISDAEWLVRVDAMSEVEQAALLENIEGKPIQEQHDILKTAVEQKKESFFNSMSPLNNRTHPIGSDEY